MQRALAVYNSSGSSISKHKVVYTTSYRRPSQLNAVALASAATSSTSTILGLMLRATPNNTVGQVIFAGDIDADTSAFSAVGSKVYLSDTPGEFQSTAGSISIVVGIVKVRAASGKITILCRPVLQPSSTTPSAPTVTSITPAYGATTGSTAVTIVGTEFYTSAGVLGVSSVTIGGSPCTSVSVGSETSLTAVTPSGTAGAQDVVVTTPYGSDTLAGGFTYIAAPTVTSITPNSGVPAGSTSVTIVGTNFLTSPGVPGVSSVTIGGNPCTSIYVGSSTSLTAVTPAGSAGAQDVVVTTSFGTGTLAGGYTYGSPYTSTKSISFDGVDDGYVKSGMTSGTAQPALFTSNGYSLSLWVKLPQIDTGIVTQTLFHIGPGIDYQLNFLLHVRRYYHTSGVSGYTNKAAVRCTEHNGTDQIRLDMTTGSGSTLAVTLGVWTHIVITSTSHLGTSSGTMTGYVDGSSVDAASTSSYAFLRNTTDMAIGKSASSTSSNFAQAQIDEVQWFNKALTSGEVTAIYNSGVPTDVSALSTYSNCVGYWQMGEDSGTSSSALVDQLGTYSMTGVGAPTITNDVPGWTPASIPQTVLWVDASDSLTVTVTAPFSTTIVSVKDKGYENTNWSGAGTLSEQTFTADTSGSNEIFHDTISGVGNGNKFFRGNNSNFRGYCVLTPSASPYNLTSGAGSAAIESDWLFWQVCYAEHTTPGDLDIMSVFARGGSILQSGFGGGHSPAAFAEVEDARLNTYQFGDWINGSTAFTNWKNTDVPAYTNPSGTLTLFCVQSYDDGGTRKYRYTKDGSSWFEKTISATNGTSISAAANKWELGYSSGSSSQVIGIGEAGFCGGVVSDADIAALYLYANSKWDLS